MLTRVHTETDEPATIATAGCALDAATGGAAPTLDAFLSGVGPRAFRFAEIALRQRDDALDAVQDAMARMLAYRMRPADEWTPLFWRILRTRVVDLQRRRAFRLRWLLPSAEVAPEWDAHAPSGEPDPALDHEQKQAWSRIAAALARLPRRQREAFSLRVLEELDVAATAQVMGCSEGSVKTHLSRARDALQRQLEEWR
jgi:RNA polymerase sigma-70 factor (ECF subfamily)